MKDAVGGSLLLYVVLFFVGVIILFFANIMSYSKAYRVKNRIINILEQHGDIPSSEFNLSKRSDLIKVINEDLVNIGYRVASSGSKSTCNFNYNEDKPNNKKCKNFNTGNVDYCVCRIDATNGFYYEVITFTQFDFPVLNSVIKSDVHGETKILGHDYEKEIDI